jgi:hypothetical protein
MIQQLREVMARGTMAASASETKRVAKRGLTCNIISNSSN